MTAFESLNLRNVTQFTSSATVNAIMDVLVSINYLVHLFLWLLLLERGARIESHCWVLHLRERITNAGVRFEIETE